MMHVRRKGEIGAELGGCSLNNTDGDGPTTRCCFARVFWVELAASNNGYGYGYGMGMGMPPPASTAKFSICIFGTFHGAYCCTTKQRTSGKTNTSNRTNSFVTQFKARR